MRIGTWNMEKYPLATVRKGPDAVRFIQGLSAEIWLLTEVNAAWQMPGGRLLVSTNRSYGREQDRWAGIHTALPMDQIDVTGDMPQAAAEALCLARLTLPDPAGPPTLLVACSVLPWKGAGRWWPGLPEGQVEEFCYVLRHHAKRIAGEVQRNGEPLLWGGDLNQTLAGSLAGQTESGRAHLRSVLDDLDLVALTEQAEHAKPGLKAIDHLCVDSGARSVKAAEAHRPPAWAEGRLSDHAAYTAEVDF